MRRIAITIVRLIAVGASARALDGSRGSSISLGPVYWVDTQCHSRLANPDGVESVTSTAALPPGASLSLKRGPVIAAHQNCPNPIPGATVILKLVTATPPGSYTISYTVYYRTMDGPESSYHAKEVVVH